jgi:hypothetical protein
VAMVKARRKGSVNLVMTQAIAKVPTVDEEKKKHQMRPAGQSRYIALRGRMHDIP